MRKCRITVWDYNDAIHGGQHFEKGLKEKPVKYEVDAWCVGGNYGIKAFFFIKNMLCMADGDDGHWWMVDSCHMNWVSEIKEAIECIAKEEADRSKNYGKDEKGNNANI